MSLQQNISLKPYNSFGIEARAAQLLTLEHTRELSALGKSLTAAGDRLVLGGGSNILFTRDVETTVILNRLMGISQVKESPDHVWLKVAAGENWHRFVLHTIAAGLSGIENLSLIPGCVGAAPMQNIGAYGVEVKDTIEEVEGWHWDEQRFTILTNEECRFGYRESIFKQELKNKVLITAVTFRLNKQAQLNTSYGAIREQLAKMGVAEPSVRDVSDAVIAIRSSKLPDPAQIGNAGSFFKNPAIPSSQFLALKERFPELPSYPAPDGRVKIPAGWLIEQCGWKGYREGDAGVHALQALVLVNYGNATGAQIWQLSRKILDSVSEKFGVALEREVNIW